MVKFVLSRPQRMLYRLAIAIFVIALALIVLITARSLLQNLNRGISISYTNHAPIANGSAATQTLAYGEPVTQSTGESVLTWNGNSLYLLGPAVVTVESGSVTLQSGYAYLQSAGSLTITLNGHQLTLPQASGIYDADIAGFTVFDGAVDLANAEVAKVNNTILFDGAKFTTASFDRSQLQTDKWKRLLTLVSGRSQLPLALSDTIPPEVSAITPTDNSSTAETVVNISGSSEPGAGVRINKQTTVADTTGKFSLAVNLPTGTTNLLLVVSDAAGNETNVNLKYTRTSSADANGSCNQTAFADQLLCLINLYRGQKQLSKLTLDPALTAAAAEHSGWMSESGQLSDTGNNNSTPASRCNTHGTTCTAETVFKLSQPTAQSVLEYLQTDTAANANLLGTHASFGGAVSGDYGTIVYH